MNQSKTHTKIMKALFNRYHHALLIGLCMLFLAASMTLTGCSTDSNADSQNEIVWGAISPEDVTISVGEHFDFSAIGLTADGDSVQNANFDFEWRSSDSSIFTVDDKGTITAKAEGAAYCIVGTIEEDIESKRNSLSAIYVGWDSASVSIK